MALAKAEAIEAREQALNTAKEEARAKAAEIARVCAVVFVRARGRVGRRLWDFCSFHCIFFEESTT